METDIRYWTVLLLIVIGVSWVIWQVATHWADRYIERKEGKKMDLKSEEIIRGSKRTALQWLDNGCYPGYVLFSYQNSYSELVEKLKALNNAEDWLLGISGDEDLINKGKNFGLYRGLEKDGEIVRLFYIILKDEFTFTDEEYCKLAHEVLHIGQFFLPAILDRDREIEAEAYYNTYLMKQCLKVLRKATSCPPSEGTTQETIQE